MRIFIASWGLLGIFLLVGRAIWRLSEIALEGIFNADSPMASYHWLVLGVWVVLSAYSEGYKGFQKKFSPRTVARAWYLADHPTPMRILFAPFFTMGFFYANRKTKITAYVMVILITGLVLLMHQVPHPWRGIIDGGVVVGLLWGLLSILLIFVRSISAGHQHLDPCLPSTSTSKSEIEA